MVTNSDDTLQLEKPVENGGFADKPEWLTEDLFREFLVGDFPNFNKITKFVVKSAVPTGENFMTVLLRVTLEVQMSDLSPKSTSYMVKIRPKSEQMQVMIKEFQVFEKEQTTYTKFIPSFEESYQKAGRKIKFAPQLLELSKVQISDDVLMMEDLRLKGFKNFNRHLGLDMLHTEAVLKKLAQFHAASAHYVQMGGQIPALYDQCLACNTDMFADHRMNSFNTFSEHMHLYGDVQHLKEKLKIYVENQFDPFQVKSEKNADEFNVLNHGDLWVNNIMFQYNEDGSLNETYFIDFQMGRYGSPAQDLIYFILSSVNLEVKLKDFDYFISYYHQQLIEHLELINYGGKLPKLRDIQMALYKHDYWAYTTISALLPIVLCEPREDASVDNVLGGEEGQDFRQAMYSNMKFAECMRVILPWLDNRGAFDL